MRCLSCGRDNSPEARFCGNCGATLGIRDKSLLLTEVASRRTALEESTVKRIGFWMRFCALTIDVFFLFGMVSVLSLFLGPLLFPGFLGPIFVLLFIGYFWLFTGLKGKTVGKMVCGIQVVDRRGNVPGLGRAALREILGKPISAVVLFLGFLWVVWDGQKQGWHDKIAGTYVVRRSKGGTRSHEVS